MTNTPAGWQPDPTGRHQHRYWNGSAWTDDVADAGVAARDPFGDSSGDPSAGLPPSSLDPTVVEPADDPTATAPAFPPAAPPPRWPEANPTPDSPVSGGSGGSKRRLWIGLGILGAVAIAVLAVLLFGNDDDDGVAAGERTDVSEDTSDDRDGGADDTDDEVGDDEVGDDMGDLVPPTFDPGDAEGYLTDLYREMFNLSDEQAECLGSEMAAVIEGIDPESPDFAPDMGELFEVVERCGIDLSELGSGFGG